MDDIENTRANAINDTVEVIREWIRKNPFDYYYDCNQKIIAFKKIELEEFLVSLKKGMNKGRGK